MITYDIVILLPEGVTIVHYVPMHEITHPRNFVA